MSMIRYFSRHVVMVSVSGSLWDLSDGWTSGALLLTNTLRDNNCHVVIGDEFFSQTRVHRPRWSWHHVACPDLETKWAVQFQALIMNAEWGCMCAGRTFETMRQGILPCIRMGEGGRNCVG